MLPLASALRARFEKQLSADGVPEKTWPFYLKWLRFYLDYCGKYEVPAERRESLPLFLRKLQEKKVAPWQQEQASQAVAWYYRLVSGTEPVSSPTPVATSAPHPASAQKLSPVVNAAPAPVPASVPAARSVRPKPASSTGASWQAEFTGLTREIKLRHYSPKTLSTYTLWLRKFQAFVRSKPPETLAVADVKEFLSWLAVKRQVAASTQNQAFNALLFFFRHVLGREFGKVDGVVRAKRRPYIPVVLNRQEIDAVLAHLEPPYDLVVKLLYGCGLRLFECLNLRLQSLNFDQEIITVHDGKGQKDRTVPLPQTLIPAMHGHLETLKILHQRDLARQYAGVFLMNSLDKKYPNAAREFAWQWFFPATYLTKVPATGEYRRYHLHETQVQKAIKKAVTEARLGKRASAHTFRHSFASHLLQANYDIRTIQQLLGHSDLRTTMIYTHTVKSTTIKDARSPLDLGVAAGRF